MSRVPWEVKAVLALTVLDGIAVIATYSRFPATELYNVHDSGTVAGGFGRELVAPNFPFASTECRSSAGSSRRPG